MNAIELLSTHPRLQVASDFDGTISSFTNDYNEAVLNADARVALRKLSELPNTFVTVISGRSLKDLSQKFHQLERVRLVGSHGHEFDLDKIEPANESSEEILARAKQIALKAVESSPGVRLEIKPHGLAFHYRGLPVEPQASVDQLKQQLSKLGCGLLREGNKVLEYSVVRANKGEALLKISEQIAPTITIFLGDDSTDEDAFEALKAPDVTVKIGVGDSRAQLRLDSPQAAVELLARIAERRSDWVRNCPVAPIDRHAFLSDLRTMALVDDTGCIDWLCAPRLDSAPLFGSLVGGPASGFFRIGRPSLNSGEQRYRGMTLITTSCFDTYTVTDFLDCSSGRPYQRAGRSDLIRVVEGRGEIPVEFAPKFNFGRVPTKIEVIQEGLRIEYGEQRSVLLSPGTTWEISREGRHDVARTTLDLQNSKRVFSLLLGTASGECHAKKADLALTRTKNFWESWAATLKLPQSQQLVVARSAVTLRGLTYGPTGAIAAAATTSLPEHIGGERNWDYRYCWPRDASWTASAMLRLGNPNLGLRLLDWILEILGDADEDRFLAPLYTVTGHKVPPEAEVQEAIGYRGSRPVRIGNLAAEQLQLDALGPIAELLYKLSLHGEALTSEHFKMVEIFVQLVESRWKMPDSGIWEVRGEPRHFVYSKLMCWYTVHCCSHISRYLGVDRSDWETLSASIRSEIESQGFDEQLNSYIAAYDLREADAALLWIILAGFHAPDHPRSKGTLQFIMKKLLNNDMIYRYHFEDALRGSEGEFLICRSWLIEALALTGSTEEARKLFDQLLERTSPCGLLSEEWDAQLGVATGNFPQAYSHLGLINAACALESALNGSTSN